MNATALPFSMLTAARVYDLCKLRQDVFVVEQECAYADLDGRDVEPDTRHVLLVDGKRETSPLVGCARVVDDRAGWRIGRVALLPSARGKGRAAVLVHTALAVCRGRDVVLDAQSPLVGLYADFGFAVDGPEFVEDGIPHTPMRRPA